MHIYKKMYLLVLLGSTSIPGVAFAADAAAADAPAVPSNQLEEITVTARKTKENLVDVPLAVTAATAQTLDQRGITDITQLSTLARA